MGNNVSPKMSSQMDKNGNQTFVSGTWENKIVTTVMPVNSGIDSGNKGGSVKDRMSMWNQKKTKSNDKSAENEQKEKEKRDKMERDKKQRDDALKRQAEQKEKERVQQAKADKLKKEKQQREEKQRRDAAEKLRLQKQSDWRMNALKTRRKQLQKNNVCRN